jgi:hypothetical protein
MAGMMKKAQADWCREIFAEIKSREERIKARTLTKAEYKELRYIRACLREEQERVDETLPYI